MLRRKTFIFIALLNIVMFQKAYAGSDLTQFLCKIAEHDNVFVTLNSMGLPEEKLILEKDGEKGCELLLVFNYKTTNYLVKVLFLYYPDIKDYEINYIRVKKHGEKNMLFDSEKEAIRWLSSLRLKIKKEEFYEWKKGDTSKSLYGLDFYYHPYEEDFAPYNPIDYDFEIKIKIHRISGKIEIPGLELPSFYPPDARSVFCE